MDSLITNLKIIGMIQVNDKLCIRKGHLQIDSCVRLQFLSRWFYKDSRDSILNFLNVLVKINLENMNPWMLTRLLIELENVCTGLNNLKSTYISDPYMIVKIDYLIDKFKEIALKGNK
jgi:hypothetical protein